MKRILVPLLMAAALSVAADVDLYGDFGWSWRTEFDKEWTPANYFNQTLELGTRVRLDEGVSFEAEIGSYSTIDSSGVQVRTPVQGGAGTLSSTLDSDVRLKGVRALWEIVPRAVIGLGDYEYTVGGVRNVDRWSETDFYSAILSKRGARGLILNLSDFSGVIGVPWNDAPENTVDKSLTFYGQYTLTAIDNVDRSLVLIPAAEVTFGDGRTRVWNFGVDFSYADHAAGRPYTFDGAVGFLDVKHKPVWTFLVEPSVGLGVLSVGTSFYYAVLNGDDAAEKQAELAELDMPLQMFASIEPQVEISRKVAIGFPVVWNNPMVDVDQDEWTSAGLTLHLWPTRMVTGDFAVRYNKIHSAPDYWELEWKTFLSF